MLPQVPRMIAVRQVNLSTPHREYEAPKSSDLGRRDTGVCPQVPR